MNNMIRFTLVIFIGLLGLLLASTITTMQLQLAGASEIVWRHPRASDAPIAASGNIVYIAWSNNDTGHWNVLFTKSNDDGKTFLKTMIISSPNKDHIINTPVGIAASGSHVYITWTTNKTGKLETVFRTSNDGGSTFGNIVRPNSTYASIATPTRLCPRIICAVAPPAPVESGPNNVYAAESNNYTGHWNVFFTKSTDGGKTFKQTIISLPNPNKGQNVNTGVNIAASGSNVYVSWWTNKTGTEMPVLRASNDNGNTFGKTMMLNSTG